MSLVNKYLGVKKQIETLKGLKQNYNEANELQEISNKINELDSKVSEKLENSQLFRKECKLKKLPTTFVQTQLIANLSQRFAANPTRQSIVKGKGKDWVKLGEEVDSFTKQVGSALNEAWREFCNNAFSGQPPDELKNTIALTEQNESLLGKYKAVYNDFLTSSKQFPKESNDFVKIHDLGITLKTILTQIDTNVPEDVKRFFDNVNYHGGASLELLTTTVINWLREHDSVNRYRITRRIYNN